jgi:hypothetical protein
MLPGHICTLVLDIEVLRLGQEEDCQTGGSQVKVNIGPSQAAVCGRSTRQEGGLVTLSGGQGWLKFDCSFISCVLCRESIGTGMACEH